MAHAYHANREITLMNLAHVIRAKRSFHRHPSGRIIDGCPYNWLDFFVETKTQSLRGWDNKATPVCGTHLLEDDEAADQ